MQTFFYNTEKFRNISERLIWFVDNFYSGNKSKFAAKINMKYQQMQQYCTEDVTKRKTPSLELIERFENTGINRVWLAFGEGEPFAINQIGQEIKERYNFIVIIPEYIKSQANYNFPIFSDYDEPPLGFDEGLETLCGLIEAEIDEVGAENVEKDVIEFFEEIDTSRDDPDFIMSDFLHKNIVRNIMKLPQEVRRKIYYEINNRINETKTKKNQDKTEDVSQCQPIPSQENINYSNLHKIDLEKLATIAARNAIELLRKEGLLITK